jgi:hypothetical protein
MSSLRIEFSEIEVNLIICLLGTNSNTQEDTLYVKWFSWSFWISVITLFILQFANFILTVVWRRATTIECKSELDYLIVGNTSSTYVPLNQSYVIPQMISDACKQAASLYTIWIVVELFVLQLMLFVSKVVRMKRLMSYPIRLLYSYSLYLLGLLRISC